MADTKISALTAATSANDADSLPIIQGGLNKKATVAQVRAGLVHAASGTPEMWIQSTDPGVSAADGDVWVVTP